MHKGYRGKINSVKHKGHCEIILKKLLRISLNFKRKKKL